MINPSDCLTSRDFPAGVAAFYGQFFFRQQEVHLRQHSGLRMIQDGLPNPPKNELVLIEAIRARRTQNIHVTRSYTHLSCTAIALILTQRADTAVFCAFDDLVTCGAGDTRLTGALFLGKRLESCIIPPFIWRKMHERTPIPFADAIRIAISGGLLPRSHFRCLPISHPS